MLMTLEGIDHNITSSPDVSYDKVYNIHKKSINKTNMKSEILEYEEQLQAMEIQSSIMRDNHGYSSNNHHISFDFITPIAYKSYINVWKVWHNYVVTGILILSLIVVLFKSSSLPTPSSSPSSMIPSSSLSSSSVVSSPASSMMIPSLYSLPYNLRHILRSTSSAAKDEGSLKSFTISKPVSISSSSGFEFVAFAIISAAKSSSISFSKPADPLDVSSMPSSLIVAPVGPHHTLTLNKFNSIPDHAMLISNVFEEQSYGLTADDLYAWYMTVDTIGAVGFYNSDIISGASQRHKHMQLIPMDEVYKLRAVGEQRDEISDPLPLDAAISSAKDKLHWHKISSSLKLDDTSFYQLPQFAFKHAIALLLSPQQLSIQAPALSYHEYLYTIYEAMISSLKLSCNNDHIIRHDCALHSNNVILTNEWMFIAKRKQPSSSSSSTPSSSSSSLLRLNGMSYTGLILAGSIEGMTFIDELTDPMMILNDISSIE